MSIALALFNAVNACIPPRPFFAIRRWALNAAGVKVGRGARIGNCVRIYDKYLEIGCKTWVGPEVSFFTTQKGTVRIGSQVDIAPACKFFAGTHELGGAERRAGDGRGIDITVGDGCWIGGAAKILPVATIGPGSVIAAGSVVTAGQYPANVMLAGNPARVVKHFETLSEPQQEAVLTGAWKSVGK
jgi:maltose O-acetyltransferase